MKHDSSSFARRFLYEARGHPERWPVWLEQDDALLVDGDEEARDGPRDAAATRPIAQLRQEP